MNAHFSLFLIADIAAHVPVLNKWFIDCPNNPNIHVLYSKSAAVFLGITWICFFFHTDYMPSGQADEYVNPIELNQFYTNLKPFSCTIFILKLWILVSICIIIEFSIIINDKTRIDISHTFFFLFKFCFVSKILRFLLHWKNFFWKIENCKN